MKPKACKTNLQVRMIGNEALVFNRKSGHLHRLNAEAARIWSKCDGTMTVDELSALVNPTLGPEAARELVELTLNEFADANIIESRAPIPVRPVVTRRALIRKFALSAGLAATLPIMESIISPRAANAADDRACRPNPPGGATGSFDGVFKADGRGAAEDLTRVFAKGDATASCDSRKCTPIGSNGEVKRYCKLIKDPWPDKDGNTPSGPHCEKAPGENQWKCTYEYRYACDCYLP